MKMSKVYCSECKHHWDRRQTNSDKHVCRRIVIETDTAVYKSSDYPYCKDMNKNNKCSHFKQKKKNWFERLVGI